MSHSILGNYLDFNEQHFVFLYDQKVKTVANDVVRFYTLPWGIWQMNRESFLINFFFCITL